MKTNVKFECVIAIGIGGVAVLELIEWPQFDFVKNDILMGGAEGWLYQTRAELPAVDGIYSMVGEAFFPEDESTYYTGVVFSPLDTSALER